MVVRMVFSICRDDHLPFVRLSTYSVRSKLNGLCTAYSVRWFREYRPVQLDRSGSGPGAACPAAGGALGVADLVGILDLCFFFL